MELFGRYGDYYDLLYRDKDYAAEAEYVTRVVCAAAPGVRTVLELGSGTGIHGRIMAAHGLAVTGIERSETMVALARARTASGAGRGGFECVAGDIRSAVLGRVFDAVVSLFHVVSYQTTNADLEQTFATAARHLVPRGVFFFDVWHGPAVLSDRPAVRIKRVEDERTRLWRISEPTLDPQSGVVTVDYTILAESKADRALTTFEERHRMRYLFPTEIEIFAAQAGFDVERSEEFVTGAAPSEQTFGVAYLLRKRA